MNINLTKMNISHRPVFRPRHASSCRDTQRGVALVMTLLLLSLVTVLSLGMVIAFSSQTLIGGYYRNYRGAFYAADSGLNIARQQMMAELVISVPTTFVLPPPANACGTAGSITVGTTYASPTSLNTGTASQSWNESFKITNVNPPSFVITPGVNSYSCAVTYGLTSVGTAQGTEQQTVTETGAINFIVLGGSAQKQVGFSYFGAFIDKYPAGIGPLVPGTMTGPMFTNNSWEFMAAIPPWTAPYIFTDPVGQVNPTVDYWDASWGQHWSSATSYGSGANLVAPQFQQGLNLNQLPVGLPANAFSQAEAVADGNGSYWTGLTTQAQTTAALIAAGVLANPTGHAYAGTGTSGIYFNKGTIAQNSSNAGNPGVCAATVTPPCMNGGGFYVEGGADVQLIPSGNTAQIYKITQSGVTTTITVDPGSPASGTNPAVPATTTIAVPGNPTVTLNGVPMDTITSQPSTMVYVDGQMTIHGPGEGQGAVQDNAMITLTAYGDVVATGDVLYKTEPVTIPSDTLVPATSTNPMNQVLGIFTAHGNFVTQDSQADQNIQVDGSIATISSLESAGCGTDPSNGGGQTSIGHINTFNNVGGMVQSCIYAADVNAENTWFDRRFTARPGFMPPWFPSTTITNGGPLPSNPGTPTAQRVQWLSMSSQ